ncbi:hypothetical protein [Rhizobium mesoamericanum]|uniref:hypothetical protein n=1 Tax=Rhizobium mesoamericanum TaxID=1079800 RepID=UPI000424DB4F|nr:hypothetical protein [Rhizobium mesoamericanum]
MKIGSSIPSTNGPSSLYSQSRQRHKRQISDTEVWVRHGAVALQPINTPCTLWALRQSGTMTMNGTEDLAPHDAVVSEFTDLADRAPAERIRSQIREHRGSQRTCEGDAAGGARGYRKQMADELKRQLTGERRQGQTERRYETSIN